MKVKYLIKQLESLPQNAEVFALWDGAARSTIDGFYLAQSGNVIGAADDHSAYDDEDRPVGAPSSDEDPHYSPVDLTRKP